jgi:hypothetical protein
MNKNLDPHPTDIEGLLASERVLVPQSEDVRRRAFARARSAMARGSMPPRAFMRFIELRWVLVAASLLFVGTISAAAIRAYRKSAPISEAPFASPARLASGTNAPSNGASAGAGTPAAVETAEPARAVPVPDTAQTAAPRAAPGAEGYVLELKVLEPARAAIVRGEFAKALVAIADHERRFPRGQLAEEREAMRVQALSGLHRTDEARRVATAFRKRFPESVLLPRMNEALQMKP